ncbi:MAG: adenine nucleotide alpha hydrolase [Acidobacteria bacterium]|nr:adenine nucleotide alpha hydrolase [Acidobacteriota bacterium]
MKIVVSWSSGKDSAWMLHGLRQRHPGAVQALLTTTNEAFDRVAMHGVRRSLVEAQALAARLPIRIVPLPWPCSHEDYERRMGAEVASLADDGFTHVAFGDLFLEDVRRYREERLARTGLTPLFPLWLTSSTADLANEMIGGGLEALVTCVDPRALDRSFAGRRFDESFLRDLPPGVDPCGERGEFHTFVCGGPMLEVPIPVAAGEVVERDGFVYCDLSGSTSGPA